MSDMYDTCPPARSSLRTPGNRISLSNAQPSLDAKIVIMGSVGVGKTSLVTRYVEGRYASQTTTTTGAFFHSKKVTVDGTKVRLQIWDTAGQERFRSMAPMYYRGANAAILVYDITNASSFEDVKLWIEELKRNCDPDLLIFIVGAKADLAAQGQRVVTSDRARLALHKWFPPAPPPAASSPSTATTAPGTPKTEGVYDYYIRPRLTSLASTRSVPFGLGSVSISVLSGATKSDRLASPGGEVSSGASASSTSSGGTRRRPGHAYSRSFAGRLEDEGYGGEESPVSEERGRVKRRTPSGGRELETSAAEFTRSTVSGWPTRRASADNVVFEDDEEEESWGLGKGMELREVSAKDDRGVKNLFDAIIAQIIKRKDLVETERVAKERDLITLGGTSPFKPGWDRIAQEEEAAMSRRRGGGCCAV